MGDSLGDRMKTNYEGPSKFKLTRRLPVIIRLDGRAFHTYTKGFKKPFDPVLMVTMVDAATKVAEEMQGFKIAYIQSDEVSFFLSDTDLITTQPWFGNSKSKMESVSASLMTAHFNRQMLSLGIEKLATFDARSFSIPDVEVANYFLWRAKDWERNSLSMYCQANFSHKQLHGKRKEEQHELLHSIGKNWTTDLTAQERNGTYIIKKANGGYRVTSDIHPDYTALHIAVLGTMFGRGTNG